MAANEIIWTPEFTNGHAWYGPEDCERLSFTDISEFLIDQIQNGDIDPNEALAENETIEVAAYNHMPFERPRSRLAEYVEQIDEQDGIGDPDGDYEALSEAELDELAGLEAKMIDRLCELYEPWGCEQVATVKVPFRAWWGTLTDEERGGLK
jgi:hypothetical protein